MKCNRTGIVLLAAACLCLASTVATAEEAWQLKVESRDEHGESTLDLLVGAKHVRGREVGGSEEFILGPDGVTTIDHGRNEYTTITFAQMEEVARVLKEVGGLEDMMAQAMKKAMATMSEEDRAEAEKYLRDLPDIGSPEAPEAEAVYALERGGGSETIAGLEADRYIVTKNGEEVAVAWLTDAIDVEGIVEVIARFSELAPEHLQSENVDVVRHLTGFPAKLEGLEHGQSFVVVEADRTSVGADAWTPPAGFEANEMTMTPGGR